MKMSVWSPEWPRRIAGAWPAPRWQYGRCCLLAVLLILCAWPVYVRSDVLDLATAQAIALAENPGIAEMQARYEALREVAPQQATLPDPVVSIGAMNFPWDEFDRNQEPMTQLQLGVSQVFPFPGKLDLREDIALMEAEIASHSVAEGRLNLAKNVALSWWQHYYLDRALETVQKNLTLLRKLADIASTKYEVGSGLQQDVLLAQLELSKALDHEITLRAMRDQARIRLNVLLGRAPDVPVRLPSTTPASAAPVMDTESLFLLATSGRPVLAGQRASIAASESRLELARRDYYPDLKVGVTYGNRDEDDFGKSRQDFLSVMVSVNVPLYAGARQDRAVQQRSREVARSQYALTDTRNQVRQAIAESLTDYRRAASQRALLEQGIIPQARQTVESMTAGYQVDQVDFLNLVRSQVTLFNYELQYWQSVSEASQALARLQAAVGEESIYE